jgi:DNA-binding NtrC family response regulator
VALFRILVVDDSPAVRETVGILLGNDYEVHSVRVGDYAANSARLPRPDLVIAARTASIAGTPFAADTPILWLDDGGGIESIDSIPRRFSPRQLRRRVADLLAAPAATPQILRSDARLARPFVPAAAIDAIAHARETDLPLHFVGEPGTGKRSIAAAVHAARGGGPFLAVPGAHFDASVLRGSGPGEGTLFIDAVESLPSQAQHVLLAALDAGGRLGTATGGRFRVVTTAVEELDAAVDAGRFLPALYYRLTVLCVRLPPLRERAAEIPALAQLIAAELAALLGRPQVTLTDAALERLAHYLWFGNLAELEAVLARTIALARDPVIDAGALLFDGSRLQRGDAQQSTGGQSSTALRGHSLDLIINELAHEFKNPLVTIKTFAHHLRSLPRDSDNEQVARLTGEAVAQIDQTLENLLEFTRLEAPVAQTFPLSAVVKPWIAECGHLLGQRGGRVDHTPVPAVAVHGDPQQIGYALTNLVRAVTRDLPPKAIVHVGYAPPATLTLALPEGTDPLGSHLATLLDAPPDGSAATPLGVAIAHAVLERNGAVVAVADGTPSTITVRFSPADEEAVVAGNGTSPRTHR